VTGRHLRHPLGRIVRSTDFERVLACPTQARSRHFAVHFLNDRPSRPGKAGRGQVANSLTPKLSTGQLPESGGSVDESPGQCWLGAVVPKRHARRAVTRNLLKRQIRQAVAAQSSDGGLPPGLWVVRLRSAFDVAQHPSAASASLRHDAGLELAQLMADAARRAAA
jgi:ribonuclease P protein component